MKNTGYPGKENPSAKNRKQPDKKASKEKQTAPRQHQAKKEFPDENKEMMGSGKRQDDN